MQRARPKTSTGLIFWENFDYQSLFWKESSSLRYTHNGVNSYLRVKVLKFTGPSDFSYERIITPLEGLKVLKQLIN